MYWDCTNSKIFNQLTAFVFVQYEKSTVYSDWWRVIPLTQFCNAHFVLQVQYVTGGQYRLFNKSDAHLPYIYFQIPRSESVLKPMYDPTSVKDDGTLKAELIREARKFNLKITGELERCPGMVNAFSLNIFYFIYMKRDWAENRCYVEALSLKCIWF